MNSINFISKIEEVHIYVSKCTIKNSLENITSNVISGNSAQKKPQGQALLLLSNPAIESVH